MGLEVVGQLGPGAPCGWHERPSIVLVVEDGVGDIPLLQRLVQGRGIAIGVDGQHEQLTDLLRWRQMVNIRVDPALQASSWYGCRDAGG